MSRFTILFVAGFLACSGPPAPISPEVKAVTEPDPRPDSSDIVATETRGLKEVDVVGTGARALDLRFQIRAHAGGEARYISPGETLETGDRVEMFVELDQPAHVYIVQFFADESTTILFPKGTDPAQLSAGRHRIPKPGKMFELDASTGNEHVYVVASREALENVDAEVAGSVDELKTSDALAGAPPRRIDPRTREKLPRIKKKPKLLSLANRGSSKVSATAATAAVAARGDRNGVLVFRFWFRHR